MTSSRPRKPGIHRAAAVLAAVLVLAAALAAVLVLVLTAVLVLVADRRIKSFAIGMQVSRGTLMTSKEVRTMTSSTIRRHACPRCGTTLDEGPIMYRCARCSRSVYAADVDTEFRRPTGPRA